VLAPLEELRSNLFEEMKDRILERTCRSSRRGRGGTTAAPKREGYAIHCRGRKWRGRAPPAGEPVRRSRSSSTRTSCGRHEYFALGQPWSARSHHDRLRYRRQRRRALRAALRSLHSDDHPTGRRRSWLTRGTVGVVEPVDVSSTPGSTRRCVVSAMASSARNPTIERRLGLRRSGSTLLARTGRTRDGAMSARGAQHEHHECWPYGDDPTSNRVSCSPHEGREYSVDH